MKRDPIDDEVKGGNDEEEDGGWDMPYAQSESKEASAEEEKQSK